MAGKKLLVADDSLTIQKVIRLALSNEGYEIQAVSDGNDAIQQISLFRPDAVLIDVSLPGKTAFEVKRAINEHADLEEVRFILMSSAFEKVDEPQASEVRFHGRLTKPFDPAHLRQVLTETLAQVAAKRLEPTSLLQRPASMAPAQRAPAPPPSLPPMPDFSEIVIEEDDGDSTEIEIDLSVTPPAPEVGDDWLTPVQPNEPAMAPPPPTDDANQLWDQEPTLSTEVAPHGTDRDADIRHLTESTIRMSGLDDFEWSVNEPSLKPPSQMLDSGDSNFQIETVHEQTSNIPPFRPEFVPEIANISEASSVPEVDNPSLTGLPEPEIQQSASPSDFYRDEEDVTKKLSRPSSFTPPAAFPPGAPAKPQRPPLPPGSAPRTPPPGVSAEASVVGITSDQIEDLLRKELQKLLPELAEKIIKQEIHRMLSAPQDGP